jgi:hypothetical protein
MCQKIAETSGALRVLGDAFRVFVYPKPTVAGFLTKLSKLKDELRDFSKIRQIRHWLRPLLWLWSDRLEHLGVFPRRCQ